MPELLRPDPDPRPLASSPPKPTLNDVFLRLTGRAIREESAEPPRNGCDGATPMRGDGCMNTHGDFYLSRPIAGFRRLVDPEAILMLCQRDLSRSSRGAGPALRLVGPGRGLAFIFGAGLRGSVRGAGGGCRTSPSSFPGMLVMAVIFASLQSAISVIFDREFGFLKEILVAPMPRTSIVIGKALAGATISTIQGVHHLPLRPLVGPAHVPSSSLAACAGDAADRVWSDRRLACLSPPAWTSFEGFGTINNFIILPLYFTSGAQFPLDHAPDWMKTLSRFNPLVYSVDLLRGLLVGQWSFDPRLDLAVLVGFALVALCGATYAFTRQE